MDSQGLSNWVSKFFPVRSQVLGPIKWLFKASNQPKHYKTLKQSVTSSRIKSLPHGVCRNTKKPVPTRYPRRVEQLSFLSRRIPKVRSPVILERRCSLSKKNSKPSTCCSLSVFGPTTAPFLFLFEKIIVAILSFSSLTFHKFPSCP